MLASSSSTNHSSPLPNIHAFRHRATVTDGINSPVTGPLAMFWYACCSKDLRQRCKERNRSNESIAISTFTSAARWIYWCSECIVSGNCNCYSCRGCQVTFLRIGRVCYLMSLCVHMHLVVHLQLSNFCADVWWNPSGTNMRVAFGVKTINIYIYTLYYIRTIQYYTAFVYSIFVFTSGRLQLWQVVEDVCLVVAPQNGDWYTCCSHQNPGQQLHYSLHAWNIYLHTYGLHTIASPRLSLFSESLLSQVFPSTPEAQGANGIVPKIRIRKAQRREGAASGQIQHLTRSITMGKWEGKATLLGPVFTTGQK